MHSELRSTVIAALEAVQDTVGAELGRMSIERGLAEYNDVFRNKANMAWAFLDKLQMDLAKLMFAIKQIEAAAEAEEANAKKAP